MEQETGRSKRVQYERGGDVWVFLNKIFKILTLRGESIISVIGFFAICKFFADFWGFFVGLLLSDEREIEGGERERERVTELINGFKIRGYGDGVELLDWIEFVFSVIL